MNQEQDRVYEVEIKAGDLSPAQRLKPYAAQTMFEDIAQRHLDFLDLNMNRMMEFHLAWVLVSVSIQFQKPVTGCGKLYATTWYSQRKGPYFRRELLFRDEQGDVVFSGSTFSVIMDLEKRGVFRAKELPFVLNEPLEEFTIEARPTRKFSQTFQDGDVRKVYPSFLDCLGHVNNCRYGELAYDSLPQERRENLDGLKRMELYFQAELSLGEDCQMQTCQEGETVLVRGCHPDGTSAFEAALIWDTPEKE